MPVEKGRDYSYSYGIGACYRDVEGEPSLCLYRDMWLGEQGIYVVALSMAHCYTDPKYLARALQIAAHILGLDPTDRSVTGHIRHIIEQHFDELVKLPPPPRVSKEKLIEQAITEHRLKVVRDGQVLIN